MKIENACPASGSLGYQCSTLTALGELPMGLRGGGTRHSQSSFLSQMFSKLCHIFCTVAIIIWGKQNTRPLSDASDSKSLASG